MLTSQNLKRTCEKNEPYSGMTPLFWPDPFVLCTEAVVKNGRDNTTDLVIEIV